jgi:thiosulfate/3-mercaptopyruvate sulfurtransferase
MKKVLLVLGAAILGMAILMMVKGKSENAVKVVDMNYVTAKLQSEAVIIDVRSEAVYNGEAPGGDIKGGHIPGAINLPLSTLVSSEDDKVKLSLLKKNDITEEKEIITYCNTGKKSQQFAETLVKLGYTNVNNYKGSMKEWGSISTNIVITN